MKALIALPALVLAACTASLPPPSPTGSPTAGFQQTASVGSLQVTPIALVEDSRCPVNARCVWAGRLVVKARIRSNGGREQLDSSLTLGQPIRVGATELTLVSALPEKLAGQPSKLSDYRFTFEQTPER